METQNSNYEVSLPPRRAEFFMGKKAKVEHFPELINKRIQVPQYEHRKDLPPMPKLRNYKMTIKDLKKRHPHLAGEELF